MNWRSLLFVPADRPERFAKAAASGADAIILDLEDAVAPAAKAAARAAAADYLAGPRPVPTLVRINPLGSGMAEADLAAILSAQPDAVMLPKAEGAPDITALHGLMGKDAVPILPIATETPRAVFQLGSYGAVADMLAGLTWGAEDLPAAIGAATARQEDGRYTPPYEMVRALTLFGAHAAGVAAIETVFPAVADEQGLAGHVARARRDGFTGMMAIHPRQIATIHAGFAPSAAETERARRIIAAFAAAPDAGALMLDGQMVDAPHLAQARALLARSMGQDKR